LEKRILSKVRIKGLGSNACCAGPDLRFAGTALSDSSSIKSLTMKSLFEKFSKVKLGPRGKIDLPPDVRIEALSIAAVMTPALYQKMCSSAFLLLFDSAIAIVFAHGRSKGAFEVK
jgi:hypothetical protein